MSAGAASRTGILKLWLLNLVANAAAIAIWYYWLLIPDAHGWQLAWSAVLAFAVIVLTVWLRAGTLAWFRVAEYRTQSSIGGAFRRAWRHIPALAIWAALGACIGWLLISAGNYTPQFSVWIRQRVNAGPSPRAVMHNTDWFLFVLLWVVLPGLWLPVATTVSAFGFAGAHIRRSFRVLRRPLYWATLCLLIAFGAWVPYRLATWVPDLSALRAQAWSAGLRFAAAYIILITLLLLLIWMVGERTEREDVDVSS
jgi:hypothetical protein